MKADDMVKFKTLYHWTHVDNLPSIARHGLSTAYAETADGSLYLVEWRRILWAAGHVAGRHNWQVGDLVLLAADVEADRMVRTYADGVYRVGTTIEPDRISRCLLTHHVIPLDPRVEAA